MKWSILVVVCLCVGFYIPGAQGRTVGKRQAGKFLIAGCGWGKIAVLDKQTGEIEWEHRLNRGDDCNDVELTRRNEILYAYTGGARLVTWNQKIVWDYRVKPGEELFTATELSGGRYLLGICGHPARIVELNRKGEPINEMTFDTGIGRVHNQFRQILKTKRNTYILPLFGTGEVVEINREGKVLKRVKAGGNLFSVKVLRGGSWLVGCGDAHKWVVLDPRRGTVLRTVHSDSLSGVDLLFVAEVCPSGKGHVLVANWNGHSRDKTQPKLLEVDERNRVVWQLEPSGEIVNISAVFPFRKRTGGKESVLLKK